MKSRLVIIECTGYIFWQFIFATTVGSKLSDQLIDQQRLKDLEKKKDELETVLETRQRELEESENKYSKAFVEFQAKISKFEEEKKKLLEEVSGY